MSRFRSFHTTPDNNSGPAAPMEKHVVKRILGLLLLAGCEFNASAVNLAPAVAITAPVADATVVAPSAVTLTAEAADSDGTIAKVEFFNGATLLATVTQAPYTYVWNAVTPGSYTVTAKATDDLALAATSAAQTLTVTAPDGAPQAFFIFSDQVNTAREITNSAGVKVWQADPEPFGANLPNENPAGLGAFVYNPRFPGQYFDRETGLHYNYYRDYDPQTGRYVQSDPIGLGGGINTYAYVEGNPLSYYDINGLVKIPDKVPDWAVVLYARKKAPSFGFNLSKCSSSDILDFIDFLSQEDVDLFNKSAERRPDGKYTTWTPEQMVTYRREMAIETKIIADAVANWEKQRGKKCVCKS